MVETALLLECRLDGLVVLELEASVLAPDPLQQPTSEVVVRSANIMHVEDPALGSGEHVHADRVG
jgi:hypothetical protein